MQGSRSEGRSNWKQAVRKDNPVESRIFGANRELPNKFAPVRLAGNEPSSKSIIKHRSNYSHDEIAIGAILLSESRERSSSREPRLERKSTEKVMGIGNEAEPDSASKAKLQSFKSIDVEVRQLGRAKEEDIEIVRELKLEFLRFKERVLKELRKQEEELKAAIQQIYDRLGRLHSCTESPILFRSSPAVPKLPLSPVLSLSPNEPLQSPISKYLQALNRQAPDFVVGEVKMKVGGPQESVSGMRESASAQLRQGMGRLEELVSSLKQELNEQMPMEGSRRKAEVQGQEGEWGGVMVG